MTFTSTIAVDCYHHGEHFGRGTEKHEISISPYRNITKLLLFSYHSIFGKRLRDDRKIAGTRENGGAENQQQNQRHSLAVVQQRFADFDGETRGVVETIPFGVHRRTGIRVEGDVGPCRRLQRSRFRRRPTRTRVCNNQNKIAYENTTNIHIIIIIVIVIMHARERTI